MPGTPPTSPNLRLPRFADLDAADYATEVNSLVDAIDANVGGGGALHAPGDLIFSAAATRPGSLICDGAAYSRTNPLYAPLFAAIGVTYGAGNGTSTFNVPDMRGRVPVGAGAGTAATSARARGQAFGEETHYLNVAEMPGHGHPIGDPGHSHPVNDAAHAHTFGSARDTVPSIAEPVGGGTVQISSVFAGAVSHFIQWLSANAWGRLAATDYATSGITVQAATTSIVVDDAGGDQPHNNVQPSLVGNWFVKL